MRLSNRFTKFKHVMLLGLALLLAAGTLPASAEGENADKAAEEIVLTFWQPDLWDYAPVLQAYADRVEYPLAINIESIPLGEYSDKLKLALASGDVPDLLLFPNWRLPEIAGVSGGFADLNKLNAGFVSELRQSLAGGVWGTVNPVGRRVSFVPLHTDPSVWLFRTDLFKKAGLPSTPEAVAAKLNTWNAVAAAGKPFKQTTKRAMFGQPSAVFDEILEQKSPIYYDAKGAYIGDRNPQIKKAYDTVVKGVKEGWIGRYESGTEAYGKALASGSLASVLGNNYSIDEIKRLAPGSKGKWAIAPVPDSAKDGGVLSAAIPAGSPHPDIAFDIIRFLTEEGTQNWVYNAYGLFPSSLAALSEEEWLGKRDPFFGNRQVNRALAESVVSAAPYPLYAENDSAPAAYRQAVEELVRNAKADPAKLWASAVKNAKAEAAEHKH